MNEKKKKIFIIIGVIAALIIAFLIYWKATEYDRYVKKKTNDILETLSDYRSGEIRYFSMGGFSDALEDPTFIDFLSAQASDMIDNEEYYLLYDFLGELENADAYISEIQDDVTNSFESADDLEEAFRIKEVLEHLDYYNTNLNFNRDSTLVATYIESNGIKEITTTPGTGFYANEKDSSSKHTVGLSNSPLYDACVTTYRGDFKIRLEFGVTLNSFYEETSYSDTSYYFRDNYISFSPDDGECVYSGDYLFCFASNGMLIGYEQLK